MLIDCDTCAVRDIQCGDCVVGVLLGRRPGPVELDSTEEQALGALAGGGLLPPLRLVATMTAERSGPSAAPSTPGRDTAIA